MTGTLPTRAPGPGRTPATVDRLHDLGRPPAAIRTLQLPVVPAAG